MKKLFAVMILVIMTIGIYTFVNHTSVRETGYTAYCEDGEIKVATRYVETNWKGEIVDKYEIVRSGSYYKD